MRDTLDNEAFFFTNLPTTDVLFTRIWMNAGGKMDVLLKYVIRYI